MRNRNTRGFTLIELLVVVGIMGILAGLLGPAIASAQDAARRAACASNLHQIGVAAISFSNDGRGPRGRSGFFPHAEKTSDEDGPDKVGEVFERLVRTGYLGDPRVLQCQASLDVAPALGAGRDLSTFDIDDTNVQSTTEFSFGWVKRQLTTTSTGAPTLLAADRSITSRDGTVAASVINHRGGRNVLFATGGVEWITKEREDPSSTVHEAEIAEMLAELNLAE